eukprot:6579282-Prymnesium_polylepis.1
MGSVLPSGCGHTIGGRARSPQLAGLASVRRSPPSRRVVSADWGRTRNLTDRAEGAGHTSRGLAARDPSP